MSTHQFYEKYVLPEAKYWLKELEYYGENQFKKKTEASTWTIGQVYEHVTYDTLQTYLAAIDKCLNGDSMLKGGKSFKGWLIFTFGSYLGLKFKAVESYTPAQPENLTKATDKMYRYLKEMQRVTALIDKSSSSGKVKHAEFGALNATEWYKLCHMHMLHHRKQKSRIDEILRRSPKEAFGEEI